MVTSKEMFKGMSIIRVKWWSRPLGRFLGDMSYEDCSLHVIGSLDELGIKETVRL